MKTEQLKKIREALGHPDRNAATREELFGHCAVLFLLDIIEKGNGLNAFSLLANHFPDSMPEILKEWVTQQSVSAQA